MKEKYLAVVFHVDFHRVGSSRDTCHAWQRKCLVKDWQKKELDEEEWFSRKTKKKKEMEEEKKTDNPSIGEWLPPTDNVTALERHARKEYSILQYSAAQYSTLQRSNTLLTH